MNTTWVLSFASVTIAVLVLQFQGSSAFLSSSTIAFKRNSDGDNLINRKLQLYDQSPKVSVDVSDIGLTMEDLQVKLEDWNVKSFGTSSKGYYNWVEGITMVEVEMIHPGIRGQPLEAIRVDFTSTTVTVCVFGYAVWSGVLAGSAEPSRSTYALSSNGVQPIITFSIEKSDESRWNEFISSVGVDSLLQ